jgi:hypothetical protein
MTKPTMPRGAWAPGPRSCGRHDGPYEFRPDELVLLEDACREVDVVDKLEKDLKRTGLWVTGSMGQDVANPLIALLGQHRSTLAGCSSSSISPTSRRCGASGGGGAVVEGPDGR